MKHSLTAALVVALVVVLVCLLMPQKSTVSARSAAPGPHAAASIPSSSYSSSGNENATPSSEPLTTSGPTDPTSARHPHVPLASAVDTPSGPEVASGLPPVTVLENMRSAFHQYQSRFGGNPVGTNKEITQALNGGNQQSIVFLDPDAGLRINDQGELIDNWGTPFFFHQLSRTVIEIHSAGPDRKMWTADDLVIK